MHNSKLHRNASSASRASGAIPRRVTLAILVSVLACGTLASAGAAAPAAEQWATGRILVMPRAGLPAQALYSIVATVGGHARKIGQSDLHIVYLPPGASETAAVQRLSQNPHIQFAELDRKVSAKFTPNDPYFGSEWHLAKVQASAAWDTSQGAGVTIAILDSGVDGSQPDLVPNLVAGYNFYNNNTNTSDVCGHGTAVAGTAAAATNNGTGVAGIVGQAKMMPVRVAYFDTTYNECYACYSTISSGLTYAADHDARIANISYGGVSASSSISAPRNTCKAKPASYSPRPATMV
jgi:subtilisin family serine protease